MDAGGRVMQEQLPRGESNNSLLQFFLFFYMAINKAQVEKSYATNFLAAFKVLSIKVGGAYLAASALDLILNAAK